ncbi:transcription initiation factor TFIID subunit 4-like isoform X2 [Myripristis murdjan]|uniref:transcription initiation factor TFIID subunit 4-like isoform X2 n=1 Tax=Myripristis murdjan TaxID=586833 RepID=UPI001176248F|nr:transcription initiation factor TFIID subunit 4-like isoform X2 [Myripristis murdjan]
MSTEERQEASRSPDVKIQTPEAPPPCGPTGLLQPPSSVSVVSMADIVHVPPKLTTCGQAVQPAGTLPKVTSAGPPPTPPPVLVVAKVGTPGRSAGGQPQFTKLPVTQIAPVSRTPTPASGRTLVIAVPRTTAPQPVAVAPRLPQTTTQQLPANIQIPSGMVLIRSDSGQLMLVSQQALAQAQQAPRATSTQTPGLLAPQVPATATCKKPEKLTVVRLAAPPSLQPAPQKPPVVKVVGVAPKPAVVQTVSQPGTQTGVKEGSKLKEPPPKFSQETLDNVKKCKNFLVTLIKLASSDSQSADMANNVRGLEGSLEPEEFTEQLYRELKSTPQPFLVPFLKKSLPALRHLTVDAQFFVQQTSTPGSKPAAPSGTTKPSGSPSPGPSRQPAQLVFQQPRGVTLRPAAMSSAQSRIFTSKTARGTTRHMVIQSGSFALKRPLDPPPSATFPLKNSSGSYKEDDDINDVTFMAGVNLREENARILTSVVGSVVQSCQDQLFLSPSPLLSRILHTGEPLGVTDVGPDVVALVSHATQECLRGLLHKLSTMAEHRKAALKEDLWHTAVSDVRSQLRFLEDVEAVKKRRRDEEERERLLRLARSRSHTEDPLQQQLKQRAKELQQIEAAQLQHREANLTALAAIGPRKKKVQELTGSQASVLPRPGVKRVTRVTSRDLLLCMEQERFLRRSLTLYKAML